jgi:hypothetical protein
MGVVYQAVQTSLGQLVTVFVRNKASTGRCQASPKPAVRRIAAP